MKKKLTELANDVLKHLPWGQVSSHTAEELADYLMDNGVRVYRNGDLLPRGLVIENVLAQMEASKSPTTMKERLLNLEGVHPDVPDTNVGKWIPAFEPPEKDGRYFVAVMPNFFSKPPEYYRSIASFTHNLEEVDDYDFRGKNRAGWYDYDSEYGYYELERVAYWMSLPKLPGEE